MSGGDKAWRKWYRRGQWRGQWRVRGGTLEDRGKAAIVAWVRKDMLLRAVHRAWTRTLAKENRR